MIGSIKGKITFKGDRFLLVETNGVGYKINVSTDNLLSIGKIGEDAYFFTHLHVREDAMDLYGFPNIKELEFFEMLINVSGIGPRGALTILGVASIETLQKAISTNDISYLTKISGIGKKTAEKMIIELRDKIGEEENDGSLRNELDALLALQSLGYSQNEARNALKEIPNELDINKKIKEALKILGTK
ncbi:MAG: Holliday junction branch migration protein RuvA [bacterium]